MKPEYVDGSFGLAQVLDSEQCQGIMDRLNEVPEHFWYTGGAASGSPHFLWMGSNTMPEPLRRMLFDLKPKAPTLELSGYSVRLYRPGDSSSGFTESSVHAVTFRVPLHDGPDGMQVRGEFVRDAAGRGVIFCENDPTPEVPRVSQQRYELIYMFDEKEE